MSHVWLFLHLLGFTMWLGGGLGAMFAGIAAKREDRRGVAAIVRAQGALYRIVIGPGALLTVLSGLILTLRLVGQDGMNVWLIVMQAAGVLGALLVLFVAVPTSARLSRLDPEGQGAGFYDELRNRLKVTGMISGTLGLVAMLAGALVR
jgi:uncharacterized membrane protein